MSEIEEEQTVREEEIQTEDLEEISEEPDADIGRKESPSVAKKSEKEKQAAAKPHTLRFVIILVLAAVVILGGYLHLTNQSKNSDQQAEENMTETQVLKNYDLAGQYPKQARDVVKLYCRYLKCMYNESLSAEELEILNTQIRKLYSEALLAENSEMVQFSELQKDVENFHAAGKIFIGYTVDEEENVKYSILEDEEYAIVNISCNIKEGASTNTLQLEYLLIKENEQWKVWGWQEIITE